jgi:hypothetical protein
MDFTGKVIRRHVIPARMPAGAARMLKAWELSEVAPRPDQVFLSLTLEHEGSKVFNDMFLTEPKRCQPAPAKVLTKVTAAGDGFTVRLSADAPAFHAALAAEGVPGEFSDNFFTILPDAPRVVEFVPRKRVSIERFRRALSVRHLRETWR